MRLFLVLGTLFLMMISAGAHAQTGVPDMPEPIAGLKEDGAQIRYLGREHGFDAWLTVKNGVEQYFYVPPGGTGFVMGVLFDNKGRVVTVDQVQRLQNEGDDLLDSLSSANDIMAQSQQKKPLKEFQSPAERLFYDIENSNWVRAGYPSAPVIYTIIDPRCPHCHAMIQDMRSQGVIDRGAVQLRIIPVGFSDASEKQAAYLLASPDPQDHLFRHLDGDEAALPVRDQINVQGVRRNLSMMQAWKFDVTPMLFYRAADGTVKIVRGRPENLDALLKDLKG